MMETLGILQEMILTIVACHFLHRTAISLVV